MGNERSKCIEFVIADHVPGVKKSDVIDGILETRKQNLIYRLRSLPDSIARQVFRERATGFLLTHSHPHH